MNSSLEVMVALFSAKLDMSSMLFAAVIIGLARIFAGGARAQDLYADENALMPGPWKVENGATFSQSRHNIRTDHSALPQFA